MQRINDDDDSVNQNRESYKIYVNILSYEHDSKLVLLKLGIDYGVSEATVCRTIMKIEHVLLASGQFTLPSKRTLLEECSSEELVIIDATEQAIERPKKNKKNTIVERRNIIPKKLKY